MTVEQGRLEKKLTVHKVELKQSQLNADNIPEREKLKRDANTVTLPVMTAKLTRGTIIKLARKV